MRDEVFTAIKIQVVVFLWSVKPRSDVVRYQRFRGPHRLSTWHSIPKHWYPIKSRSSGLWSRAVLL